MAVYRRRKLSRVKGKRDRGNDEEEAVTENCRYFVELQYNKINRNHMTLNN